MASAKLRNLCRKLLYGSFFKNFKLTEKGKYNIV